MGGRKRRKKKGDSVKDRRKRGKKEIKKGEEEGR